MKSSLWMVITVVTGLVGFLVGYSVSAKKEPTGIARTAGAEAVGRREAGEDPPAAPAVPAVETASTESAKAPATGGYGPAVGPAAPSAGGYGTAKPASPPPRKKKAAAPAPAAPKPAAGGY